MLRLRFESEDPIDLSDGRSLSLARKAVKDRPRRSGFRSGTNVSSTTGGLETMTPPGFSSLSTISAASGSSLLSMIIAETGDAGHLAGRVVCGLMALVGTLESDVLCEDVDSTNEGRVGLIGVTTP